MAVRSRKSWRELKRRTRVFLVGLLVLLIFDFIILGFHLSIHHPIGVATGPTSREDISVCSLALAPRPIYYSSTESFEKGRVVTFVLKLDPKTATGSTPKASRPPIDTACEVGAQLSAVDLTISPPGWRTQSFAAGDDLKWQWQVTSSTPGTMTAFLTFNSTQRRGGISPGPGAEITEPVTFDVTAPPQSLYQQFVSFVTSPVLLALVAIAVLVVGIYGVIVARKGLPDSKRRRRIRWPRRNRSKETHPDESVVIEVLE
jgi:hypothetical protein